jgi:hypothetical protein
VIADLSQAQVDLVSRRTEGDPAAMRRATVTGTNPFTISMNGVSVVSPPKLPSYVPIVNDIVLVLMDGAAPLVIDRLNTLAQAIGAKIRNNANNVITPSVQTTLTMTTAVEDAYGYRSGSTLVVPVGHGGKFILSAHARWDASAPVNGIIAIMVNGTPVVRDAPQAAVAFLEQHCETLWTCAAGDIVRLDASHTSASNRTISTVTAGGTDPTGPILEMWRL